MKKFYTGPLINAELLVVMLEKHGIFATQQEVDGAPTQEEDLSRPVEVLVPESDYERAFQLFYSERQDEL
jgi:hypothetical protein